EELTRALKHMQDSRKYLFLCDVLLWRATALRYLRRIDEALMDINSLLETSHRCEMVLSEASAWIVKGHVQLDERSPGSTSTAWLASEEARKLINANRNDSSQPAYQHTNYDLFQPTYHLLKARIAHFERGTADEELETARQWLKNV